MLNEKKFKEIYDQYRESGLTVRDFCLNQGIAEAKFYYWQHKLRNNLTTSGEFVPLVLEQRYQGVDFSVAKKENSAVLTESCNTDIACEIAYPNGTILKLKGQLNPDLLRSLINLEK